MPISDTMGSQAVSASLGLGSTPSAPPVEQPDLQSPQPTQAATSSAPLPPEQGSYIDVSA